MQERAARVCAAQDNLAHTGLIPRALQRISWPELGFHMVPPSSSAKHRLLRWLGGASLWVAMRSDMHTAPQHCLNPRLQKGAPKARKALGTYSETEEAAAVDQASNAQRSLLKD